MIHSPTVFGCIDALIYVNKVEIKAAASLASVYVLRMLGLFMVMPVLAILTQDYAGYSAMMVGLAIGGYGLTQALLQIPMGILSDRIGRKPVIIGGLVLFAAGSIVAGMAENMSQLIVGRVLQGAGAIAGAVMALAADVSRESERTKMMAIIGVSIGFSFYLAVILGPVISSAFGLSGIFMVTAGLAALAIPLVYFVVPQAVNAAPQGDTLPVLKDIRAMLANGELLRLNLSVLILHMMITLLFTYLPEKISAAGWPLARHWELYLPVLILSVAGLVLLMRMAKGWAIRLPLMFSVAMLLVAFAGYLWMPLHMSWLMVFTLVFFIGFNFLESNLPALVSSVAPAGKKGSAMGLYASFQFFGAFLGGAIAGVLRQYEGIESVFILAILLCICWLLLLAGLNGSQRLKRYTLTVNVTASEASHLAHQLANLAGVNDVTVIPQERAAYLKVDDARFNLQQARQIVGEQQ